MERLIVMPAPQQAAPGGTAELAWADLDREWSEFWAGLEAHADNPGLWFTPERAGRLEQLLARGKQWRLTASHAREDRDLYACHLRRLQPVLADLQRALADTAEQILRQRQQLRAAGEWAHSQGRARPPRQPR